MDVLGDAEGAGSLLVDESPAAADVAGAGEDEEPAELLEPES